MENILNKALSEVLTPLYSEELRGAFDTGYKFSSEFEDKMRELIRKTDRPVTKYIGYMAAAACAVIAIGSAIIIPTIINGNIDIQEPENTAETVVTTTVPESPDNTSDTTAANVTAVSTKVSESDTDDIVIDDYDDTVITSETTSETTSPEVTSSDAAVVSDITENDNDTQALVVTDEKDSGNDGDDCLVVDNISVNPDTVDSEYDEETLDVDECDSDDDIVTAAPDGDYEIALSFRMEVKAGDKLGEVMAKVIPGFSYENLWATSGEYSVNGSFTRARNITETLNFYRCDYDFIQDVVHKLGEAVSTDSLTDIQTSGQPGITLWLSGNKVSVRPLGSSPQNVSAWKNYNEYFGIDEEEYSTDVDCDDGEDPIYENMDIEVVKIFRNGVVETKGSYVITDNTDNKNYLCELSNNRFIFDSKIVDELFEGIDSTHISSGLNTVGEVSDSIGITADNIESASVRVDNIYDTLVQDNKIAFSYIETFLSSHAKDKVYPTRWTDSEGMENIIEMNGDIEIEFYTKKCSHIKMYINTEASTFTNDSEFICFIGDNFGGYYFNITQQDIEDMLKSISEANNYSIPIYHTLSEYLADKNFNTLTEISYSCKKDDQQGWYRITDKNDLKKIRDFLKDEFKKSSYLFNSRYNRYQTDIGITVKGYHNYIKFDEDDIVTVQAGYFRNKFKLSDGFYAKFAKLITECESVIFEPYKVEEELDEIVDDVDEEEVVVDD